MDGSYSWCSLADDPDNLGCLQFHHRFTEDPSAIDDNILVSEPRPSWMH